jgi:hypothetical protein
MIQLVKALMGTSSITGAIDCRRPSLLQPGINESEDEEEQKIKYFSDGHTFNF